MLALVFSLQSNHNQTFFKVAMNEIKENTITLKDFDCICRICLRFNENMIDIFVSGIDSQITEVTNLKVKSDDKLPKTLCQSCNSQMDHLSKFLQQAKYSDTFLRSLLSNSETSDSKLRKREEKYSPGKKFKKRTKSKLKNSVDSDQMYLIVVPKENETNSENQICIKDLNCTSELTSYCRTLVKNHFADHTYPKEFPTEETKPPVGLHRCDKSLENFESLLYHLQTHQTLFETSEYSFTCPACGFSEKEKNNFINHLNSHKEEGLLFEESSVVKLPINKTDKRFNIESCKLFKLNFSDLICAYCLTIVGSQDLIQDHLKSCLCLETPKVEFSIRYTCPVCQEAILNEKNAFLEHLVVHQTEGAFYMNVGSDKQPVESDVKGVFMDYSEALELINLINGSEKVFKIVEPFSCLMCECEFETYDMLLNHCTNIHSQEIAPSVLIVCPVCLKEWNTGTPDENRAGFYEHLKEHKNESVYFVRVKQNNIMAAKRYSEIFTQSAILFSFLNNTLCLVDVWLPEIILISQEDSSQTFTCDLCQKQFSKKQSLAKHLKSHQGNYEKVHYICEKCGKKFVGRLSYKKHFSKHMKSSIGKKPTCAICNKAFANRATLNGHVRQHLKEGSGNEFKTPLIGIICEKCGKSFSSSAGLTKHKKLHSKDKENSVLKCEICGKDFFRQSSFDRHKSAHLNPKYFECDVCKLPLPSFASFQKHSEIHQNGSNTFDCKSCKVSFLTKDSLTAHQIRTGHYLDRKPLECNVCHEKFFVGKKFTEHIKTHPKYKMGECTLCGKRLSTIQALMVHMDRHFESNTILCPHCGKQFFEERNYHRHLLSHEGIKPFSCDVEGCSKSFYTLFELKRHKKYHSNTRDFRCPYCSKSFHEANHLTVHVRTHTGERPYSCPHCNKGFVTRTRCKHHIKLVHQGIGYDLIRSSISKKVTVFEAIEAVV